MKAETKKENGEVRWRKNVLLTKDIQLFERGDVCVRK
jgi:hypothetical protein